jgi:hypothetical protein
MNKQRYNHGQEADMRMEILTKEEGNGMDARFELEMGVGGSAR